MKSIRKAALACVASALLALPVSAAAQGPVNQDTFFTFSQAVELPGTTLPAGTYFFQLADSPSNRHIVKVMSQDRKQLHATLLAIPYYSNDRPSDEPQVRFMETPAQAASGAAGSNAIKIWFYPGTSTGHEFIYPREQAMRIASRTGQSVLTTKTEESIEASTVADADLTRVDRGGVDSTVDMSNRTTTTTEDTTTARAPVSQPTQTAPVPSPETDRTPATTAQSTQPTTERSTMPERTAQTARADVNDRDQLPNTAGFLPLLALIGIGSLVGSRMLRRSRRI
ncbi:MAG TPA: hypothetical protein VFV51_09585 [Vicinamibacterales bacterium]|nr:hypothetical protein [Vicinamibacterales bacterium]